MGESVARPEIFLAIFVGGARNKGRGGARAAGRTAGTFWVRLEKGAPPDFWAGKFTKGGGDEILTSKNVNSRP